MNSARDDSEILCALKWYFESKNLALKNALQFRCPLSVEQQRELRQYYSEYFASLVSAIDLLRETKYRHSGKFKDVLEKAFVFDSFPDGRNNYLYVRELRNSILHRGLDVCSAAHVNGDFLLMVAPLFMSSRDGGKTFQAFGFYLLEIIAKCEDVIGPLIARHLDEVGLLKPELTQNQAIENTRKFIAECETMPEWAKQLAHDTVATIDHIEIQMAAIRCLVDVLCTNAFSGTDAHSIIPLDSQRRSDSGYAKF